MEHRCFHKGAFASSLPRALCVLDEQTCRCASRKAGESSGPERSDGRVTVTANNVGHAYSLDEFMQCFGKPVGVHGWQKAHPAPAHPCQQMERRSPSQRDVRALEAETDQSETFMDIKNNLIRLIDEEETVSTPFRLKVRNDKLTRAALR